MCKIIQWFKDQYHKIVISNDQQYLTDLSEMRDVINNYRVQVTNLEVKLQKKDYLLQLQQAQIDSRDDELESLKNENGVYPLPELDVDWDKHPYFASSINYYYNEKTKKIAKYTAQWTPSKLSRIWTDEMYEYVIFGMKKSSKLTELQKVVKLRNLVLNRCKYMHDLNDIGISEENWKLPHDTYYSKAGDCEDLVNLWLTFCNIYGIPSNKVFNLTGLYGNGGHSFGGYLDDNQVMWIIECTSKSRPLKMKGSNYRCKSSLNGITNWGCSGIPNKEQF